DRGIVALAADALVLPLGSSSKQTLPITEVTDHRGKRDPGTACHLLQRDVKQWPLPEHGDGSLEDARTRGGSRLRARLHPVATLGWRRLSTCIHVSSLT